MATKSNGDYFYVGSESVNEELDDFQIYSEAGDLALHDEPNDEEYKFVAGSGLELPASRGLLVDGTQVVQGQGSALTAQDTSTVSTTFGSTEQGVVENNRTRIAELEARLQAHGLIA